MAARSLKLLCGLMMGTLSAGAAHADTSLFVVREQTGVFLPEGRCSAAVYRDLRARLVALFQRMPRIAVEDAAVTVRLGPLAVIDRGNNERLLTGGDLTTDHVIEKPGRIPLVVARAIGSTITIEFEMEMATPVSLKTDFAMVRVAFIDPGGCTAKWLGVAVRRQEGVAKAAPSQPRR